MTNLEKLREGLEYIAKNRGVKSFFYPEEYSIGIMGECSVPTIADVQFLCEDTHIELSNLCYYEFGVEIELTDEYMEEWANRPYKNDLPEFWRTNN